MTSIIMKKEEEEDWRANDPADELNNQDEDGDPLDDSLTSMDWLSKMDAGWSSLDGNDSGGKKEGNNGNVDFDPRGKPPYR